MNLPSLYAAVTAKRPELAVRMGSPSPSYITWLPCELQHNHNGDGLWRLHEVDSECAYAMFDPYPEEHAAALILARWVEALPEDAWLGRPTTPVHGWRVCYRNKRAETTYDLVWFSPIEPSPIKALAAFYLGDTK